MKVPGLVDDLRGGQGRGGHADEIDELPVFLDRLQGFLAGPAILASKPRRERKLDAGIVDLEPLNALPKIAVGGHGVSPSMSLFECGLVGSRGPASCSADRPRASLLQSQAPCQIATSASGVANPLTQRKDPKAGGSAARPPRRNFADQAGAGRRILAARTRPGAALPRSGAPPLVA